jgi:hypothetical protein
MAQLNKLLMDVLDSYNEVNAVMNLVSGAQYNGRDPGHRAPLLAQYTAVPLLIHGGSRPRPPPVHVQTHRQRQALHVWFFLHMHAYGTA